MKRKMFAIGCCLMVLLASILSSCSTDVDKETMAKISYSTEYAEAPKAKEVALGTILSDKDLPALEYEGYVFDGWYSGTEKIEKGYKVVNNLSLKAKWTPIKYVTIKYETPNGTAPTSVKVVSDSLISDANLPKLERVNDLNFIGWYIGDKKIDSSYKVTSDITLTARWLDDSDALDNVFNNLNFKLVYLPGEDKIELPPSEIDGVNITCSFDSEYIDPNTLEIINRDSIPTNEFKEVRIKVSFIIGDGTMVTTYMVRIYNATQEEYDNSSVDEAYNELSNHWSGWGRFEVDVSSDKVSVPRFLENYPKIPKYPQMTITITSSDPSVIKNDLTVIHEDAESTKPVTLTFLISQNNAKKEYQISGNVLNSSKENIKKVDDAFTEIISQVPTTIESTVEQFPVTTEREGLEIKWTARKYGFNIKDGLCTVDQTAFDSSNPLPLRLTIKSGNYTKTDEIYITLNK